jgi:hypothetical protein
MEGQTEQFNRLLLLWLDLQQAVRRTKRPQAAPWECADKEVARLWRLITDPGHARVLEQWLFQAASGEMELWAQHALLEARRRRT